MDLGCRGGCWDARRRRITGLGRGARAEARDALAVAARLHRLPPGCTCVLLNLARANLSRLQRWRRSVVHNLLHCLLRLIQLFRGRLLAWAWVLLRRLVGGGEVAVQLTFHEGRGFRLEWGGSVRLEGDPGTGGGGVGRARESGPLHVHSKVLFS